MDEPRVACRTPAKGRDGVTRIPEWKFDAVRGAILSSLASGPMTVKALAGTVGQALSPDELDRLGSVLWHVMTVKLELEVRGDIARVAGTKPQQICLSKGHHS